MSGSKLKRGQRMLGKIGAAAVVASLAAIPTELAKLVGVQMAPAIAFGSGPSAPQAEPLNTDAGVHWFAAWDENTSPGSTDFFITPTTYQGIAAAQTQYNLAPANKPLGAKVEIPMSPSDASNLFNTH